MRALGLAGPAAQTAAAGRDACAPAAAASPTPVAAPTGTACAADTAGTDTRHIASATRHSWAGWLALDPASSHASLRHMLPFALLSCENLPNITTSRIRHYQLAWPSRTSLRKTWKSLRNHLVIYTRPPRCSVFFAPPIFGPIFGAVFVAVFCAARPLHDARRSR